MTVSFAREVRPLATVVVVTYGGWRWTREALEALAAGTEEPFEVVIVDNASPDDTAERIRAEIHGATVVLNDRNLGFGQGANQGARLARASYLVFLNSDAMVRPRWLSTLVGSIEADPHAGAAVPRYLNVDGAVQEAGGLVFDDGSTLMWGHGAAADDPAYRFRRYVDYGSAACLVVRRSLFRAVGGFDAAYRPMYVEDVDLAFALRARGFRTVYEPRADVSHVRFGSSGEGEDRARRLVAQNTRILRSRWRDVLAARPPTDLESPIRLLAARDVDAAPRIAVVAPAAAGTLVRDLAPWFRLGRLTFVVSVGALPAEHLDALLVAGVEVVPHPGDVTAWIAARPFHYDAVVTVAAGRGMTAPLDRYQPQAARVAAEQQETAADVASRLAEAAIVGEVHAGRA